MHTGHIGLFHQRVERHHLFTDLHRVGQELHLIFRHATRFSGKGHQPRFDLLRPVQGRHTVQVRPGRCRRGRGVRHFLSGGFGDLHPVEIHLERIGHDLCDLGVEALPHLGAAMVQVDRAIIVDVDQRSRLIVPGGREGDAEFHRCQRDTFADHPAFGVVLQHRLTARLIVGVFFQLFHHAVDDVVFDSLVIRRQVAAICFVTVEVRLAHLQRVFAQLIGDLFDHPLRCHNTLRATKATEGGVRHSVGLQRFAFQTHIGVEIGVIGVKQRPIRHRPRQVRGIAATRCKHAVHRSDLALIIKAHIIVDHKVMPLAGGGHVLIAIGADFAGAVPFLGRQRGNRAEQVHLAFFAAKTAAHPTHIDGHRIGRHAQNMGHHMLRFAWVLSGAGDNNIVIFAGHSKGDVAFQIHVILTTDFHPAGDAMRRFCHRGRNLTPFQFQRIGNKRPTRRTRRQRVQRQRQFFIFNLGQFRRTPCRIAAVGNHGKDRMAVKLNLLRRENGLIVFAGWADVIVAGNIVSGQNTDDPRCGGNSAQIHRQDPAMRHSRRAQIGMHGANRFCDIIAIFGAAGYMFDRAVMLTIGADKAFECGLMFHDRASLHAVRRTG